MRLSVKNIALALALLSLLPGTARAGQAVLGRAEGRTVEQLACRLPECKKVLAEYLHKLFPFDLRTGEERREAGLEQREPGNRQAALREYLRREDVLPRLEDYLPGAAKAILAKGVVKFGLQPGQDTAQLHARLESGWPELREEVLPNGLRLRRLAIKRPHTLQVYAGNIHTLRQGLRRLQADFRRQPPGSYDILKIRLACLAVHLASASLENLRPAEIALDNRSWWHSGQKRRSGWLRLYALTYNSPETAADSRVCHIWRKKWPGDQSWPGALEELAPAGVHFAPLEGAGAVFWSIAQRDNYFALSTRRYAAADADYPRPVNGRGRILFTSAAPLEEISAHLASLSLLNLPLAGGVPSTAEEAENVPYSAPPMLPPAPEDVYVVNYMAEVFLYLAAFGGRNELERLLGPLDKIWIYHPVAGRPEEPWLELSREGDRPLAVPSRQGCIFAFSPQVRDSVFLPLVQARQSRKLAGYLDRLTRGPHGSLMNQERQRAEAKKIIRLGYANGRYHTQELLEQAGRFAFDYMGQAAGAYRKQQTLRPGRKAY